MRKHILSQLKAVGIATGDTLLVAVSGGVDSVVLLHLLCSVADTYGLHLHVAHLDHKLRPESPVDADFVRQISSKLNLPCHIEATDVRALAEAESLSLEAAGRQARREFLLRIADQVQATYIVLGHHRDDQVETFLQRLLRGSGTAGLAAMRPVHGRWWRPLLGFSRRQIQQYAEDQQLDWVEDVTNADPGYLRNRLRHKLIPQLQEINPQLNKRISELCRQLQVDENYWQQQVAEVLPALLINRLDGLRLSRKGLLALPEALRMRVLREAFSQLRGDLQRLEAVHLAAVEGLLQGTQSQAQLDLPACWVGRRYETLWFRKSGPKSLPAYAIELSAPGELRLPCGRILRTEWQNSPSSESPLIAEFTVAGLADRLWVRNWQPGDCFEPQGMAGHVRLKQLFGDQKVELEERSRIPLLVSGENILWVIGMRRSRHAPAVAKSGKILRLKLI